jgi:hypothetical protein
MSTDASSGPGAGSTGSGTYDCNWGPPVITQLDASLTPPGGLAVGNVPQFVALGFDDDLYVDGIQWATDFAKSLGNQPGTGNHCTFDGTPVRFTFFVSSFTQQMTEAERPATLTQAYQDGHELANHTDTHADSLQANTDENVWLTEQSTCNGYLTGLGVPKSNIVGFRTPFLQYTSATFAATAQTGFSYDCSVEHYLGIDPKTNNLGEDWPYTLDNGQSPRAYQRNDGTGTHPGLWELPVHEFMPATGWSGVTGLDYNIWCAKMMSPSDALDLLKASLDLRFKGDPVRGAAANRAPLFVGGHTDLYSNTREMEDPSGCANTVDERRATIEEFVKYALQYDPAIRFVPYGEIMRWMQHPTGLDGSKGQ